LSDDGIWLANAGGQGGVPGYVSLYKYNGTQFVSQQLISYPYLSRYAKLNNDASLLVSESQIDFNEKNRKIYIYSRSSNVLTYPYGICVWEI
jgi:hypothetical protein